MVHAHFDCCAGISGDMILGAFVDLGVSEQWLTEQIAGLSLGKIEIAVQDVKKNTIGAKQVAVIEKSEPSVRTYSDIVTLIGDSSLDTDVSSLSVDIFSRIADAEARIHRCNKDDVHFHEVGAVDSIVDIVGAALCMEKLGITSVSSSPLPLGSGFVNCQHGKLPVPAPATLEILKGVPVYGGTLDGERVTPTGAAVIVSVAQEYGPMPDMKVEKIGYGSGTRESKDVPNVLRVLVGQKIEPCMEVTNDEVRVVETHIDDMNPEIFGYLMEKLFDDGALDVSYSSIMMKKNRPGTKIEVICSPEKQPVIEKTLFAETSTLGIRYQRVRRHTAKRSVSTVDTVFGRVQIKCATGPDQKERCAPEYEICRKIALEKNVPLKIVYDTVAKAIMDGA